MAAEKRKREIIVTSFSAVNKLCEDNDHFMNIE